MFIDCLLWTRYCATKQAAFVSTDIPTNPIVQGEPWNRLPGSHALGLLSTSLAAPSQIPLLVSTSPQSLNFASPQTQSSAVFSSPSMFSPYWSRPGSWLGIPSADISQISVNSLDFSPEPKTCICLCLLGISTFNVLKTIPSLSLSIHFIGLPRQSTPNWMTKNSRSVFSDNSGWKSESRVLAGPGCLWRL